MGISSFPPSSGAAAAGVTYNAGAETSRPSSPEAGTTFFNQTNQNLEIYTGTEWKLVSSTNNPPTWNTAAGSLGSHNTATAVSYSVSATDAEGGVVTYTMDPDNKPSWLSINSSTGGLTGTSPTIAASTSETFTVYATDSYGNQSFRDFTVTTLPNIAITYAVIAGGGGGRRQWAGGGAGGVRDGTIASAALATDYTVTVGAGGSEGTKGNNSVFSTITSTGGGGGAQNDENRAGGSGGGGNPGQAGGTGNQGSYNPVEGYDGGFGKGFPTGSQNPYPGGGGGGAGGAGGSVAVNQSSAGGGGGGRSTSLTGTVGGGGGGASYSQEGGNAAGGGSGGGGSGNRDPGQAGGNGAANSGGGGGGSGWGHAAGGTGGSGYVVLRYPKGITMGGGSGLTYSGGEDSNYKYAYFTAGTGTVNFN